LDPTTPRPDDGAGATAPSAETGVHKTSDVDGWWQEVNRLDVAAYAAIAATPTPVLDGVFRRLSRAADHWKLWLGCAAALAIAGGRRGRRAAVNGVAAMAVSSAVVNLAVKPLGARRRPDRARHHVPTARQVSMPTSTSFPSGHAAAAAAFATGVATAFPEAGIPLSSAAALVAYSRVHTGVHYPVDVVAGTVTGTTVAQLVVALLDRGRKRRMVASRN
jgi:membrane-associated phospholipid phosphatase